MSPRMLVAESLGPTRGGTTVWPVESPPIGGFPAAPAATRSVLQCLRSALRQQQGSASGKHESHSKDAEDDRM